MIISDNCSKCTLYVQYSICPFSVKVWEDQMYISGRNCLPCLKKTQTCLLCIDSLLALDLENFELTVCWFSGLVSVGRIPVCTAGSFRLCAYAHATDG